MSPCLAEFLGLFDTGERSRVLVLGEAGRETVHIKKLTIYQSTKQSDVVVIRCDSNVSI